MSKGIFSLKPTYSADPCDDQPLFSRKESKNNLIDDSPLPTSALPYIYADENDITSSPTRSHVSTSIFPPMNSMSEDSSGGAGAGGRKEKYETAKLPSASAMIQEASDEAKANWEVYKKATAQNRLNEQDTKQGSPVKTPSLARFSVRITTSQSRIDFAGKPFTSYVMCVETNDGRYNCEHRFSDFFQLHKDLQANEVVLGSPFPMKSLAGRIGDWTPAQRWAPEANKEMIRKREKMLDVWVSELVEMFQQSNNIHGELRGRVENFLHKSSTSVPPCDQANHISWDGFLDSEDGDVEFEGQMRRGGGVQKFVGNPLSFTLNSSIRQAAYTVMHMCGNKSTLTLNGDQTDQSIPLDLLQSARGLVFLTIVKGGLVMSFRGGSGLMIARREDDSWTPPVALGTVGIGWGALIGGDITNYMIVLNTDRAVKIFAQKRSVNLGAELGVAVGPVGRAASGNLNAGTSEGSMPAPAYAYAHSKGLFAGISFEGSIVTARPEINAKFYGESVNVEQLLFQNHPRPKAAQPLYDAINAAMNLEVPEKGFKPTQVLNRI